MGTVESRRTASKRCRRSTRVLVPGRESLIAATPVAASERGFHFGTTRSQSVSGPARITALGVAVEIYQDDDVFAASPGSLLDPSADSAREPPQHYLDRGWTWPPRMASESFFSYGVCGEPAQVSASARLSGTVLKADRAACTLTGQPFIIASVRTIGFEADLCLAGSGHPDLPVPGNIISGTVYISATIDAPGLKT